jgi:hypothetical protein
MKEHRPLGWTTIEEAKLLVEAGLDPNTADMSYNFVVCKVINGNPLEDWLLQPFSPDENQPHKQLPCWSLGALIVLIPRTININYSRFHFYMSYNNTEKWSAVYEDFVFRRQLFCSAYPSLLELLINVIKWLLQNNQIKKQE